MIRHVARSTECSLDLRRHYPGINPQTWSRCSETTQPARHAQLLAHATPLFEPQPCRDATDRRRFFEEATLPRNLVVLGDAVATFNPSYGQGMTTAALQAEALRRQLQVNAYMHPSARSSPDPSPSPILTIPIPRP